MLNTKHHYLMSPHPQHILNDRYIDHHHGANFIGLIVAAGGVLPHSDT